MLVYFRHDNNSCTLVTLYALFKNISNILILKYQISISIKLDFDVKVSN